MNSNKPSVEQVEHLLSKKPQSFPDFDKMWTSIEQEVAERRTDSRQNTRALSKRKFIPAAGVVAACLLIAVPVFAAVNSNWSIFGRSGVENAIQNGFGEKFEKSVKSAGATMNLHGVVTDGEQMDVLFTMDVPDMPDYDAVAFDQITLTDHKGNKAEPYALIHKEPESGKLKGLFEQQDNLQKSKQELNLNASGLSFYKYNDLPLLGDIKEGSRLTLTSQQQDYSGVTIQSIIRDQDKLTVRYTISSPMQDPGKLDPHLFITSGSTTYKSSYRAVLPPEGSDMVSQQIFTIPENEWNNAKLHFTYMENIHKVPGTWAFEFEADGKKASEVIYSKKLDFKDKAESMGMDLKELQVTPLQIRIPYQETARNIQTGTLFYNKATLKLGDHEIAGGRFGMDSPYLRFESPEWFKDWSGVPMKLVLSDLKITKRDTSKNWYDLKEPTASEQQLEMNLDGRKVKFTYYRDGKDLIIKSTPIDETFGGISQSTLKVNGEDVFPKLNPSPPATGPTVRVERYADIPEGATLQLNPGVYWYYEPEKTVELNVN